LRTPGWRLIAEEKEFFLTAGSRSGMNSFYRVWFPCAILLCASESAEEVKDKNERLGAVVQF
jgi:hypothetical protein